MNLFHESSNVTAMTAEGSEDQAWFLARAFSFTSSTTDKIIHAVSDTLAKNDGVARVENTLVDNLNIILSYLKKPTIFILM